MENKFSHFAVDAPNVKACLKDVTGHQPASCLFQLYLLSWHWCTKHTDSQKACAFFFYFILQLDFNQSNSTQPMCLVTHVFCYTHKHNLKRIFKLQVHFPISVQITVIVCWAPRTSKMQVTYTAYCTCRAKAAAVALLMYCSTQPWRDMSLCLLVHCFR